MSIVQTDLRGYATAYLNVPQTWRALQTFPLGMISIQAADIITGFTPGSIIFAGATGGLSQDAALTWDNTLKKLNLNLSGTAMAAAETDTGFQMDGADGFATTIFMDSHGATAAIDFRQQGGTKAAPTASAVGATMGQINFQGWDGTAYGKAARVRAVGDSSGATWTLTDHGMKLGFFTTAPGTLLLTEKMTVFGSGAVTIGAALVSQGAGTLNLASLYSNNVLIVDSSGKVTTPTVNKVAITPPATSATMTIADGKTLTVSNTLTFTGTDASSVAFGAGGTVLYNGGALGTPSSGTLTNCTGLPVSTGISGLGANVATGLQNTVNSANGFITFSGVLGTPSSGTLTNTTGLPLTTGVTGILPKANGGTGKVNESWQYIETLTASGSASVTSSAFTSAYDDYVFIIDNMVPATDGAVFNMTVESGGSFQTTTYKNIDGTTTTNVALSLLVSNTAGQGVAGTVLLRNVNSTSVNKWATARDLAFVTQTTLALATSNFAGFWNGGQGAVTRARFQMSSGNETGVIKVYGISNS